MDYRGQSSLCVILLLINDLAILNMELLALPWKNKLQPLSVLVTIKLMQRIFLKTTRGVNGKDFIQLSNKESDPAEICHSPYYSPSNMPNSIVYKENLIGVYQALIPKVF